MKISDFKQSRKREIIAKLLAFVDFIEGKNGQDSSATRNTSDVAKELILELFEITIKESSKPRRKRS